MRIAIFLDNINYKELNDGLKTILLFDVDDYLVVAVGQQLLLIYNFSYLITWLLGKRVEKVYMTGSDEVIKKAIEHSGVITVEPLSKIKDNPLLKSLELPID
ncbi:hypothetical protein [Prevotella sp. 10(H)]|uniref:hypothetical protein n=1 Tax=Prevotella sp. 10(H) TaxID=1158294 RepID=UPI0004A756F3|nr:hypothetical protein [Prevotella sp. 10(H)]